MTYGRITKKLLKTTAFITGGLAVLLFSFHLWFTNQAENIIEDLVESGSKGKLKMNVRKFKFNWFSNKMELRDAVFFTTDTATSPVGYRFSVKRIRMDVKKVLPIILEKKLRFDSLLLSNPDIVVTRFRIGKDTLLSSDTTLSLPQEMGRVYNSIQDALQVLEVNRFHISNGKFTLVNKIKKNEDPVSVSNIDFLLDNLQVDSSKLETKDKIFFSENVVLSTYNQNIIFPDKRHQLHFSNFHINVQNRIAEFDSCTIQATKGDSSNTSFSIFFDKLKLINVAFDTLYHFEIIKADSVFCINPKFQLDADLKKKTNAKPPTLNELIQQLIGDMFLSYVSVQNGSFNINTQREGSPNSFTSNNNNFELQGFRVQKNTEKPLVVDKFVMALHNYENFLKDSAYAIKFDSILINNDRISLSNFAYREIKKNTADNHLVMPQLELRGLSWDDLIFNRKLIVNNVTLYHPVINYNFSSGQNKKQDIFQALAGIGKMLQLDNLDIVDGQINLLLSNNTKLQLQDANLTIRAKELVNAKQYSNIHRSVTGLVFKKGFLQSSNLLVDLSDGEFESSNNRLKAGLIHITDKNGMDITAGNIAIKSMITDDKFQHITVNDISWGYATIKLNSIKQNDEQTGSIVFNGVMGKNTELGVTNNDKKITALLHTISADEISGINEHPVITNLAAVGNKLHLASNSFLLDIEEFQIKDKQPSLFKNLLYKKASSSSSVDINIPLMSFSPDVNTLINGKLLADELNLFKPVVKISAQENKDGEKSIPLPETHIGKLIIRQPDLYYSNSTQDGNAVIEWKGNNEDNYMEVDNILIAGNNTNAVSAKQLQFAMNDFLYDNSSGRSFNLSKGSLTTSVSDFTLQQTEIGTWEWQGKIDHFKAQNLLIDSIGKQQGILSVTSAEVNNLSISSTLLLSIRELIRKNSAFNLKNVTGSYHDKSKEFNWYNTNFDKTTKRLSTDSFGYRPVLSKDEFMNSRAYRSDYIKIKTGSINAGPVDIDRYITDTLLDLGVIKVNDIDFTDYRDQTLPIKPGFQRLLPVMSLQNLSVPFHADTLQVTNSNIEYEEVNEKTKLPGKILVNRLNADLVNVRNTNSWENDSLEIIASAYLNNALLTKLQVKQSYADTSGGFKMQLEIASADMKKLNSALKPLALAEINSGQLDTLYMIVTGNDDHAYGKMKMVYKDFKVTLYKIKNGKLVSPGLFNFLGNFIINNKNKDYSLVYFRRWKDRSAVNYLLKITLNGVMNSIGLKKNKDEIRKYRKEIKHSL